MNNILFGLLPKRKVFISFHQSDRSEADTFIYRWSVQEKVFISKALGVSMNPDLIDSGNPEYVMSKIRENYLEDSSVTIVLIGKCTHSRRYVDWELKSSLRQGLFYTPNGVLGIVLPSCGQPIYVPQRFYENWNKENNNSYCRLYNPPQTPVELRGWIEDAFSARSTRAKFIQNSSDMMKYNSKCLVCGVTH